MLGCVLGRVWGVVGGPVSRSSLHRLSAPLSHQKVGFRVTAGQEFQKSKKGERVVHKMQLAVSLDTKTGLRKSPQVP